ncbi:hypothetical protein C2G38_2183217 [Gigaspora rosea]|uniref:Uncharacterized protein n=1 Tax=Gigaspora rosea TaxID=44941 RepID=A0A397VCA8_9GLOM|nr:hypothetical protein C2G38_2183217 [Gigaspora rosea]
MEPTNETNLPFQYYPLYPLFEESINECSSSTKALTYPLGFENTNTDDNYTIEAQPYFDFENENVINSHEKSANIDHDEINNDTEDKLDVLKLTKDKSFDMWEIAESYFEQYEKQEEFSFANVILQIKA